MPLPEVSVIIVNWNTKDLTDIAIASLYQFEKTIALEIILVDNASEDNSVSFLSEKYPNVRIIENRTNNGFAKANNQGVDSACGKSILLLNSDTRFHQEVLPTCLYHLRSSNPCILGCKLLNPDNSPQLSVENFSYLTDYFLEAFSLEAGIRKRKLLLQSHLTMEMNPVGWICGAFLFMERADYLKLGGLNEKIFMYGEDMDFCWRAAKAGIPRYFIPSISIIHLGGGSTHYASMRSLVLTDAGRLRTFAIMKGMFQSILLRGIFICRSLLRFLIYLPISIFSRNNIWRQKMRNHLMEILILSGVANGRNFI